MIFFERERETSIRCSTYLHIHWLLLICALTGDQTCNRGVSGRRSNQLSYPARASTLFLYSSQHPSKGRAPFSSSSDRGRSARRGPGTHQGRSAGRGRRKRGPGRSPALGPQQPGLRGAERRRGGGTCARAPRSTSQRCAPLRSLPGGADPTHQDTGARPRRPEVGMYGPAPGPHTSHSCPGVPSSARRFRYRKFARSSQKMTQRMRHSELHPPEGRSPIELVLSLERWPMNWENLQG